MGSSVRIGSSCAAATVVNGVVVVVAMVTVLLAREFQAAAAYQSSTFRVGFYDDKCKDAEAIVFQTVAKHLRKNPRFAPSIIRMLFHDCFVNGCDASILLEGENSELLAIPNQSIRGFEVINDAKANLEAACPGVVSCADIIALAARDSVHLLGGEHYKLQTGRFDGKKPGKVNLPSPTNTVQQAMNFFTNVGLGQQDLVTLLGSHTVGVSQCQFFSDRLYNFSNTGLPDPSMDPSYRAELQKLCPKNGDPTFNVGMDRGSELKFDSNYYADILQHRAIFQLDQELLQDDRTVGSVYEFANSFPSFDKAFSKSMIKMSEIHIKGPSHGEVRKVCSLAN